MWDNPYYLTDFAILKSIGITKKEQGSIVIESKLFPTYFGGNLILIDPETTADLSVFEGLFDRNFTAPKTRHKTFLLVVDAPHTPKLLEQAKGIHYNCTDFFFMSVGSSLLTTDLPDGLRIDTLDLINNQQDIADSLALIMATEELEWFWTDGFKKRQTITQTMGIQWFGIRATGDTALRSSLGVFKHGDLARLQDVVTHPDYYRSGYATQLLSHAIRYSKEVFAASEVVLVADKGYHAYRMYQKLGFVDVFGVTELMKF